MASAKMETAAERYRRIKKEREAKETLFDVECPSGMTFKCRRPRMEVYAMSGVLPMSLVEKMVKAQAAGKSSQEAFSELPIEDQIETVRFAGKLLKFVTVEPRIVEEVKDPAMEISADEVELDDAQFLIGWAMKGGAEAAAAESFRTE
jgi:hypothetical protein